MLGVFMAVWSLAVLPVAVRLGASVGSEFLPQGFASVRTIGFAMRFDWRILKKEHGFDLVLRFQGKENKEHNVRTNRNMQKQMKSLLGDPLVRSNLLSYFRSIRFRGELSLGLQDAAATALTCGAINAFFGSFPHTKVRVVPNFRVQTFCVETKCIATFCLGKLLASAAIYLKAFVIQQLHQKAGGTMHG